MKVIKSAVLGTAAGFVALTGAHAADLPVKAKAVEYVKVCSLYGAGFYYIPGTDTCIRIGGAIRIATTFNGTSYGVPFEVPVVSESNIKSSRAPSRSDGAGGSPFSFAKGDRVCSSELGSVRHPRYASIQGTVVGGGSGRYPNSVRVLWDGSRTVVAIHRDYIQPAPDVAESDCARSSSP